MLPTSDSWHVSQQEKKVHQLSQLQHLQYESRSSLAPVDTSSPRKSATNPIRLERASAALQAQPVVGPHVIAKNTLLDNGSTKDTTYMKEVAKVLTDRIM